MEFADRKIADANRSLFVFVLLVFCVVGVAKLVIDGTPAGTVYFVVIVSAIVLAFLINLFIKENQSRIIEYPFSRTILQSSVMFYAGILTMFAVNLVTSKAFGAHIYEIIKPPFLASTQNQLVGLTSFKAIETSLSPAWNAFVDIITASVGETLVYKLIAFWVGAIMVFFVMKAVRLDYGETTNKVLRFMGGLAIASTLFMITHVYNADYAAQPAYFAYAWAFLAICITLLYFFNVSLPFVVGLHLGNNLMAIGVAPGLKALFNMQEPWIQIPLLIFFVATLLGIIITLFKAPREIGETFTNIDTGI
jgi:hypothetical protein